MISSNKEEVATFDEREEKKNNALRDKSLKRGFTSIISPFTLSSQRVAFFFLSILTKLIRRKRMISSNKEEVATFVKGEEKKNNALRELDEV